MGRAKDRYKKKLNQHKTEIKKARIEAWKKFCYEGSKEDPWGPAYRVIARKRTSTSISQVKREDGTYTKTIQQTGEELLRYFMKKDETDQDTEEQRRTREKTMNLRPTNEENDRVIEE